MRALPRVTPGRAARARAASAFAPTAGAAFSARSAPAAGPAAGPADVYGCGSNVVDVIFRTKALPRAGEKGYFEPAVPVPEAEITGGVTLNHLAWARLLDVPTGLLARQGTDGHGRTIRAKLDAMGVDTSAIRVDAAHRTSLSHIILDQTGERAIIMAPGSTSDISAAVMRDEFGDALARSRIATTEVSQLPLDAVEELLTSAPGLTALDVDVPPSVASTDANLGDLPALLRCARACDVLKPTMDAAAELLAVAATEGRTCDPDEAGVSVDTSDIVGVARRLQAAFGAGMVAVTDGARGSALVGGGGGGTTTMEVLVPGHAGVVQVDATGAGDAYFGGMVAGLYHHCDARLPETPAQLEAIGRMASAAGAACCEVVGALPVDGVSEARMAALLEQHRHHQ